MQTALKSKNLSPQKIEPILPSLDVFYYRNKMEYAFSSIIYDTQKKCDVDDFGLGFKKSNTWWMVEILEKDSGLFDEEWEKALFRITDINPKERPRVG